MTRSADHLPEFRDPPLNEVAIGVQFASIPGYASVNAHDVWQLYRGDFPFVQEHPRIEPQFETFGGANHTPGIQFRVGASVSSRLWFLSEKQDELIQFQPDRFFTNWRRGGAGGPYPRFANVAQLFESKLGLLATYCQSNFSHDLDVNQAEVVYVNIIPVEDFGKVGHWLSHWSKASAFDLETVNMNFTEVIKSSDDKPYARLTCGIQSVFTSGGSGKAFSITLTFRGKPAGNDAVSAMEFIELAHQCIVKRFVDITTSEAHQHWGKQV